MVTDFLELRWLNNALGTKSYFPTQTWQSTDSLLRISHKQVDNFCYHGNSVNIRPYSVFKLIDVSYFYAHVDQSFS